MVKGIINDFGHMALCLVINLRKGSNWAVSLSPIFATAYLLIFFATTFLYQVARMVENSYYLKKTLISNTDQSKPLTQV